MRLGVLHQVSPSCHVSTSFYGRFPDCSLVPIGTFGGIAPTGNPNNPSSRRGRLMMINPSNGPYGMMRGFIFAFLSIKCPYRDMETAEACYTISYL